MAGPPAYATTTGSSSAAPPLPAAPRPCRSQATACQAATPPAAAAAGPSRTARCSSCAPGGGPAEGHRSRGQARTVRSWAEWGAREGEGHPVPSTHTTSCTSPTTRCSKSSAGSAVLPNLPPPPKRMRYPHQYYIMYALSCTLCHQHQYYLL
eukprot:scaffold6026_cov132-Isochrysis_galbana.AAC.3